MMTGILETLVFKHVAPHGVRHIKLLDQADASGLVAQVYRQMRRDFQIAPPLTVHSPIPELLAGVWTAAREALISGPADRVSREAIAAAVSRINACPYCVDVHSMMLDGAGQHALAKAVSSAPETIVVDPALAMQVEWANATRSPGSPILAVPPFSLKDAPQMIGTAVIFHYINRIVNVFLAESPIPFRAPHLVKHLVGFATTTRIVGVVAEPGDSLGFLPESALPSDLMWAASNPSVAGAFARMAATVGRAGESALPAAARELLLSRIHHWRGEDAGLSRAWVEDALASLAPDERPYARLALLAAFASHQVDEGVIRACRVAGATDEALIAIVAWASFGAARKVGTWLAPLGVQPTLRPRK